MYVNTFTKIAVSKTCRSTGKIYDCDTSNKNLISKWPHRRPMHRQKNLY